jgi:hypothetical protein
MVGVLKIEHGKLIFRKRKKMSDSSPNFAINAKSCTLLRNEQEGNKILLGNKKTYLIPIFQRPYSWDHAQLNKFVSDIFKAYRGNDGVVIKEPMFIGTMQLSYPNELGLQEIIDGQQRMTTFLLLFRMLKDKFPEARSLAQIRFDWLKTDVSSGTQQAYLNEMLSLGLDDIQAGLNPYLKNLKIISELFDEQISMTDEEVEFDVNDFFDYLTSRVYFVVIETKAQLSKTLQIFNTINTTGLDLNSGDIFKIRMFQYLTQYKKADKSVFNDISKLYEKIDNLNKQSGQTVTDIRGILKQYQYILISKHRLPDTLHHLGVDTFYERLFDTLFNDNQWQHFSGNVKDIELSIEELDRLIDIRFRWAEKWKGKVGFSAEDAAMIRLIRWSRYSNYWDLIFVFMFSFHEDPESWNKMKDFVRQLGKVFLIYSIRFQRIKNEAYYTFMHEVIKLLQQGKYDALMGHINEKIGNGSTHTTGYYNLNYFLTDDLTENAKRKNLVCRLSALLSEDYQTEDPQLVQEIVDKLFDQDIDVEHIQSYHDKDGNKRENVWQEWGIEINSLGNLMILESKYNRSIGNEHYPKKLTVYGKSQYQIVREQHVNYPEQWTLKLALERKEKERTKLMNYLFGQKSDATPISEN